MLEAEHRCCELFLVQFWASSLLVCPSGCGGVGAFWCFFSHAVREHLAFPCLLPRGDSTEGMCGQQGRRNHSPAGGRKQMIRRKRGSRNRKLLGQQKLHEKAERSCFEGPSFGLEAGVEKVKGKHFSNFFLLCALLTPFWAMVWDMVFHLLPVTSSKRKVHFLLQH